VKPGLPVVYFTVFLDLVGFGIILPQLPFYAEAFGATGVWVGAILAAYSAAQLVGASVLGRLSDRVGRRPVLLMSLAGSAASLVLSGLAHSLWLLLVARGLAGLFGGSIAAAQAYIADVTAPEERAKYMGLLGASIGLGFVFGPALGSGLARFGFGAAAFTAAGLAAANLLFAFSRLPETRPAEARRHTHSRVDWSNFLDALHHPSIGRLLAATFLSTLAFVAMEATFALFGEARLGLDAGWLGVVFTYVGVVMVIVQGWLVGRLAPRFGERALATVGALVMAASLGALPLAPSLGAAFVVLAGLAVGQGLTTPMLATLLSRATDADEQGGTLGLGQSLAAAARAVGPIGAGWLYDRAIGAPYAAAAAVMVLAAVLVGTVRTD
jgi:DHA1 family tetracycline resistance protein-like MFS transporter